MFSDFVWREHIFLPLHMCKEDPWNRTQFAAMRSDPRNHETTLAVSITSLFLVCSGTSRDMIHFLGPPLTCVVPVGPQKVTCKVHLKAKARERSSSRITRRRKAWWPNKMSSVWCSQCQVGIRTYNHTIKSLVMTAHGSEKYSLHDTNVSCKEYFFQVLSNFPVCISGFCLLCHHTTSPSISSGTHTRCAQ